MTTIAPGSPIEAAQAFTRPRPRLCQRVPVAETLCFVYRFRDCEEYYDDMRHFLDRMVEGAQLFFFQDMYDLSCLGQGLAEGRYRITAKGRALLEDRLRSTYSDGTEYRIQADALRRVDVMPVRVVESKIVRSARIGYEAAALSRRIGDGVGVEVCPTP